MFTLRFLLAKVVRAPVALAMVKLLRLLPESTARAQLPRTLQGVANLLRNRLQRFRRASATASCPRYRCFDMVDASSWDG